MFSLTVSEIEDERKAFEVWADPCVMLDKHSNGSYKSEWARAAFAGWVAHARNTKDIDSRAGLG